MIHRSIADAAVSALAFGTANLSIDESVSDSEAERTIDAAIDAGIDFLDTAAAYATATDPMHSERLVGRAVARHPGLFVATKGGHTREGANWGVDGRPESIRRDCERSLRALGVDSIDLYYLHKPDPTVPFLDSVGALVDLSRQGKVNRVGLSNVTVEQVSVARTVIPIAGVQNRFGPLDTSDSETLAFCEREGIAYLPYSPLGGLSGSGSLASAFPRTDRLALERGISLQSALLAWLLSLSRSIVPIVGARRAASIVDSARAVELTLDSELRDAIESDRPAVVP
ncbi:MAG TPA: aldo/keto reductase [Galbitalea sp.]|jgi:aryl-alcohol dehydrogenase-like predicted oxidoreductase|nr:aldo/keto reductase [Galbitalea sp.]